ncbi:MAG: CoA ester lyase [Alphaproteobacteria bacterium]|nr:CoA ester lyase [Alphaproteobacteria bacterium]
MTADFRPRRSVLFMPGSNPRAIEKARALPADALIFDLEDAVAPDAKDKAREIVAAALAAGGYGPRELVLRVNALDTPWGQADLAAAAALPLAAVLLPKVENVDRVRLSLALLERHGASDRLALWCMLETPLGVLSAPDIAGASPRVAALVMGTSDLTADLHALPTRDRLPLVTALGLSLLAARAFGLAILDGVHLDLDDEDGFAAACRQGRTLGFDGKTLIHPKQIDPANAAFAPAAEDIARAHRIVAAHAEATAAGRGIVLLDGRLIENLHVAEAKRTVALAAAIAGRDAETAPG